MIQSMQSLTQALQRIALITRASLSDDAVLFPRTLSCARGAGYAEKMYSGANWLQSP